MIKTDTYEFDETKLPETLHELLALAVDDLEQVEQLDGVEVDMSRWIQQGADLCYVCLAGAMLKQSCRWKPLLDAAWMPSLTADTTWKRKLLAVDLLRNGSVDLAAGNYYHGDDTKRNDQQLGWLDRYVPDYGQDPHGAKRVWREIAADLKVNGL